MNLTKSFHSFVETPRYDTVQRMIVAGEFNDVDPYHAAMGGTRLLSGGDERRVIITLSSNRCIGFNIRGGMEYGVGIYVSKYVAPGKICLCGFTERLFS